MKASPSLAPIALFAYKRPQHLRRTLEALAACHLASQSALHIFADGAKRPDDQTAVDETRAVARQARGFGSVTIIERAENWGLARSIITGVSALCLSHGAVIVVEDDLVVAPDFLRFLNAGLERYRDDDRVMQISGYSYPVANDGAPGSYFLPMASCWGWATWATAWTQYDAEMNEYERLAQDKAARRRFNLDGAYDYWGMAQDQRRGAIDSWGIRWHMSVFARDGLVLYPQSSLVENIGVDATGTHGRGHQAFQRKTNQTRLAPDITWPSTIAVDMTKLDQVKLLLRGQHVSLRHRAGRWLRQWAS